MTKRWIILSLIPILSIFATPSRSIQELYEEVVFLYDEHAWKEIIDIERDVQKKYRDTSLANELLYFLGISYFQLEDYDLANRYLTKYLKTVPNPKYFEESIYYKFYVAEKFREGKKKHLFAWEKSPQILSGKDDALEIYEEVIQIFSHHELTVKALYGKGMIQKEYGDYEEAIETFQTLITRFAKNEHAIESFLEIQRIHLLLCKTPNLNPDILDQAEVNLRKFYAAFPGEERVQVAKEILSDIREAFAKNLFQTGKFYERSKKKEAAKIYYSKIVSKFPKTPSAKEASKRLQALSN